MWECPKAFRPYCLVCYDIICLLLQVKHNYEVKFSIKDTLNEDLTFDPLQNLHVSIADVRPSEDGMTQYYSMLCLVSFTVHTGWTGKDGSRPPPWVPLLKSYGSIIVSTSLGSKTLNTKIKDLVVGTTWPGFQPPPPPPPLGAFRCDVPTLSRVLSPNNGKVWNQVLCPHSRCFGSYYDVIFLMKDGHKIINKSNHVPRVLLNILDTYM